MHSDTDVDEEAIRHLADKHGYLVGWDWWDAIDGIDMYIEDNKNNTGKSATGQK